MNQLISIGWAQSILIQAGVLLQVIAIVALIRDKMGPRVLNHHGAHDVQEELDLEDAHERAQEEMISSKIQRTETRPIMKASRLTKTSRTAFKQEFKFRQ